MVNVAQLKTSSYFENALNRYSIINSVNKSTYIHSRKTFSVFTAQIILVEYFIINYMSEWLTPETGQWKKACGSFFSCPQIQPKLMYPTKTHLLF